MSGRFEGNSVLVIGANSGIGLATAQYFAEEGATVFATRRRQDQLDQAVELIGKHAVGVQGDITNITAADLIVDGGLIDVSSGIRS